MVLQPGGSIFFTSISRTLCSYALAIVLAEYLLGIVPRGVHDWNKFILPEELQSLLSKSMSRIFVLSLLCRCCLHLSPRVGSGT